MPPISYLDHSSHRPLDGRVLARMRPVLEGRSANPLNRSHRAGWEAEALVEEARTQVAGLVGAQPSEIVFTGSGTESVNLALLGLARSVPETHRRLVCSAVEQRSVLACADRLERDGWSVRRVPVDGEGRVEPDAVLAALEGRSGVVSLQLANGETGTLQPWRDLARRLPEGCLLHVDACWGLETQAVDVVADGVHLLSVSGHRIYGPSGVGALYVRRRDPRVTLEPLLLGGGQERGRRALVEALWKELQAAVPLWRFGATAHRLPGTLCFGFPGTEGEGLLLGLPDLAMASGAACASAAGEPSHVLKAMGLSEEQRSAAVRLAVGRCNTLEEVEDAGRSIARRVQELREQNPLWDRIGADSP